MFVSITVNWTGLLLPIQSRWRLQRNHFRKWTIPIFLKNRFEQGLLANTTGGWKSLQDGSRYRSWVLQIIKDAVWAATLVRRIRKLLQGLNWSRRKLYRWLDHLIEGLRYSLASARWTSTPVAASAFGYSANKVLVWLEVRWVSRSLGW